MVYPLKIYGIHPTAETITVRPAVACRLLGVTPSVLRDMAEPNGINGRSVVRAVRTKTGTEYRLDDIMDDLEALSDSGLPMPWTKPVSELEDDLPF